MADIQALEAAKSVSLPLPIYESVNIGTMHSRDGEEFTICAGLSRDVVDQLRRLSLDERDEEIQKNTSDRERFGTGSYEKWYGKDRTPFCLLGPSGTLAALVWYGPKQLGRKSLKHLTQEERLQDERTLSHDDWHTIVYRAYNPYRGKGLMKSFTKFTMDVYRRVYPRAKLWAGIHAENPASLGLAEALGFRVDETRSDKETHHYVLTLE